MKKTREAFDPLHRIRLLEKDNDKLESLLNQCVKKHELEVEIRNHYKTENKHLKKLINDATVLLKLLKDEAEQLSGTGVISQDKVNEAIERSRN